MGTQVSTLKFSLHRIPTFRSGQGEPSASGGNIGISIPVYTLFSAVVKIREVLEKAKKF
jgi:hypothetical protein